MTKKLHEQIFEIGPILKDIQKAKSTFERLEILNQHCSIQKIGSKTSPLRSFLTGLTPECEYVLKALIFIGQKQIIPNKEMLSCDFAKRMRKLLDNLLNIEDFYREMGGLIGYHHKLLNFLQKNPKIDQKEKVLFYPPAFVDISKENKTVKEAIIWGIQHLPQICELYPLGGAADRLHLQDDETKEELPAARLIFAGKSLLETLIQDLQAKEYLYFKIYGKEIVTPIAMMTSHEKNNHEHVLAICEKNDWFGRPKNSFKLFVQPLVPTITKSGKWCLKEPLEPLLKPGGHGVIWKLAKDFHVLEWLQKQNCKKALIRQINNPMAGIDYGLLAFTGWGLHHNMNFGFASCKRELKTAEGINILIEKKLPHGYSYALSNIEYCDFQSYGIKDIPEHRGSKYSKFSSNTNILFADLESVAKVIDKRPFPGVIINLKNIKFPAGEKIKESKVARLESTMQNIADEFVEFYPKPLSSKNRNLAKTFITYNERHKTISTAKKVYFPHVSTLETPERCFYDLLRNASELLKQCGYNIATMPTLENYLTRGPSFLFRYHPALGPLYSIIRQKIRVGKLAEKSELVCEIAELDMENLDLSGSLQIIAKDVFGHKDHDGLIHTSNRSGKCCLKNIRVRNRGIDFYKTKYFWKNEIVRSESLTIILHGNAEFHAENVCFDGNQTFEVANGYQLLVDQKEGIIRTEERAIQEPTWFWKYEINEHLEIALKKQQVATCCF